MLDIGDIHAFVEVADTGSLGRAARRLGFSKSMVSRRIARLEGELDAQLLTRTTRGIAVTDAGMSFRIYADRVLADLEAARDAVSRSESELTGSLRIAAPLSFGATHLAPVIAEFAVRHPRLRIDTSYSDRHVDLIGERFDVAIRLGDLPDSNLIARRVAPIETALVASPTYLGRHGTPESIDELIGHEAIIQANSVWHLNQGRPEALLRSDSRFIADNGLAVRAAAVAGLGIALLPVFLVSEDLEAHRLARVLPDAATPEHGLHVVRPPPARHAPRKVTALTDLLAERFAGLAKRT